MRKYFAIVSVLVCSLALQAKTLYLEPGVWETANAKYAVYYFNGNQSNGWSEYMVSAGEDVYKTDIPDEYSTVIFVRLDPSKTKGWDAKWNQTEDLTIPSDKDMYSIEDWGGDKSPGSWSKYGEQGGGDNPGGGDTPVTPTDYDVAVPSQCTDIMLQAFYWKSNSDNTYGNSQWSTLKNNASEINSYFDLVWLPPSCAANDEMGYLPKEYHNQNSKMGMKSGLNSLIKALHEGGTRVIADVVINHAANRSSWVDFMPQDFGEYGKFEPQSTWITSNDEAQGKGQLGSHPDDGQNGNDANYPDARDWDHQNSQVQAMCKAYLKFLKNTMKYDGFRFDYAGGYHVGHLRDYVREAKPYFSVMEYWNGDANHLKSRIDDASQGSLTFDFAAYYTALQNGIAKNNYSGCQNAGLRGKGYSKYSVLFVDNHDTFNRDINNDVGGSRDGRTTINNRDLMLQCNAYILSMPGVPCVFWPHWYKYKSEIKAMITARRMAGVHSESSIDEQSGGGWYKATVHGKYGNVILYLGSAASEGAPSGYTQAIKEGKVAMYYTGNGPQGIETVNGERVSGEKIMKDGQLYIRCGEQVFDVLGREVR